jgi:GR25 family glycosyltransferase involved in LPS biosynthesis
MNASLQAVRVSAQVTCHPFLGSHTTAEIFALVSARVRANLVVNTSSWGADFTNNQSVSIAFNHIQLWKHLANQTSETDMLIFEDDILVNARALQLYDKIRRSGVLPRHNFIFKLVNHHRMTWLGGSELRFVYKFRVQDRIFTLQQCVCRTRQHFLSSAAYVIDRKAARVLLQHHLPMETHVDIFMHYVGCRFSNFFVLDADAVDFSGRKSKHDLSSDRTHRILASFKEQVKSMILTTCY